VTPEGFEDESFTYVYDTSLLTNGQDYQNLVVPIDPSESFILRRVEMGAPLMYPQSNSTVGKYRIRDRLGRYLSQPVAPGTFGLGTTWSRAMVPEIPYYGGGQLRFDLFNIQNRTTTGSLGTDSAPQSQCLFHGVLRRKIRPGQPREVPPFKRQWYAQVHYVNINWPGFYQSGPILVRYNDIRRFQFQMDDYDFELYGMHFRNAFFDTPQPPGPLGQSPNADVAAVLYDPYLKARSSGPILGEYMDTRLSLSQMAAGFGAASPITNAKPYGVAYCPPILYPASGILTMDIQSLCWPEDIPTYIEIVLLGALRIPRK
jgi:hypothetical protein